jgi:hypothetical protein
METLAWDYCSWEEKRMRRRSVPRTIFPVAE